MNHVNKEEYLCAQECTTQLDDAIAELHRRRKDDKLRKEIEEYLNYDIPHHFTERPIFYLARHVATPNFETLRFIEICKQHKSPPVIGQDTKDIFVSNNILKRSLGKLPVVKSVTHDKRELTENLTVLRFDKAQGEPLNSLTTTFGENLVQFHNKLLREIYPRGVHLVDDSPWIDRNHRGNLLEHYKKFLALFILHGVMFEFYEPEDLEFVNEVLIPAQQFIEEKFGCKPLICDLVSPELCTARDWNAYPSVIYKMVHNKVRVKKRTKIKTYLNAFYFRYLLRLIKRRPHKYRRAYS
jgi:hypothetical protein